MPATQAVELPEGADLEVAALIGCAAMTGVGAVFNTAAVRPGERAVVFGCGGVGQCIVQGLRAAGAYPIVAVDVTEAALELARASGATDTVLAGSEDDRRAIRRATRRRRRRRVRGARAARDDRGGLRVAGRRRTRRDRRHARTRRHDHDQRLQPGGAGALARGLALRLVAPALRRAAAGRAGGRRPALARLADRAPLPARRDQRRLRRPALRRPRARRHHVRASYDASQSATIGRTRGSTLASSIHSRSVWSSPPTGPEAVDRGDADVARPGAVGDAARRLLERRLAVRGERAQRSGGQLRRALHGREAAVVAEREHDALVVADARGCGRARSRGRGSSAARTSITPQASAGTVFLTSPECSWVATAVMPGRAWCSSPSMRSSSRASARSAERPSSGEVPACAGTPCAVTVTQQPALREVTIAPDSRPHSRQSAASAPCMRRERERRDVAALLVGHASAARPRCRCPRGARARPAPTSTPPFMSATPGPRARSPSTRSGPRGGGTRREDRVVVAEQQDPRASGGRACAPRRAGRPARAGDRRRSRPRPPTARSALRRHRVRRRWPVGESIAHSWRRRSR